MFCCPMFCVQVCPPRVCCHVSQRLLPGIMFLLLLGITWLINMCTGVYMHPSNCKRWQTWQQPGEWLLPGMPAFADRHPRIVCWVFELVARCPSVRCQGTWVVARYPSLLPSVPRAGAASIPSVVRNPRVCFPDSWGWCQVSQWVCCQFFWVDGWMNNSLLRGVLWLLSAIHGSLAASQLLGIHGFVGWMDDGSVVLVGYPVVVVGTFQGCCQVGCNLGKIAPK